VIAHALVDRAPALGATLQYNSDMFTAGDIERCELLYDICVYTELLELAQERVERRGAADSTLVFTRHDG
jgi:hypothetical protein